MVNHPLRGPRSKIQRAYSHIDAIAEEIRSFNATAKLNLVIETWASGNRLLKVKLDKELPDELYSLVAEQVYHLRSALDQTMVAIGQANGATDLNRIYFPFAGDQRQYASKGTRRKIDQLPADVQDMLRSLEPYKEGNEVLWGLSRLSVVDKHKSLMPVAHSGSVTQLFMSNARIVDASVGLVLGGVGRLDEGIVISDLGQHGRIEFYGDPPEMQVAASVNFGEVDAFAGKPVLKTLRELTELTEGIVQTFEAHCFGS